MNKETKITIILLLAVVVGYVFYSRYFSNPEEIHETPENFSDQLIDGHIVEAKEDSIVVSGLIKASNYSERKTIEFVINPQTVLKNRAVLFTKENINSGKQFEPQMMDEAAGKLEDLRTQAILVIRSIKGDQNLFKIQKATASVIEYSIVNYEK